MMYILVGAITTAARLKRLLDMQSGIPSDIVRTPSELNSGGCSYSVKVSRRALPEVRRISREYGVNIRKIYTAEVVNGERVFNAVS